MSAATQEALHRALDACDVPTAYRQAILAAFTQAEVEISAVPADPAPVAVSPGETEMTLDEMVNRFLSWPLPKGFAPDCGISFDGRGPDARGYEKQWPIGTNLLTAGQAREMLVHVLGNAVSPVAEAQGPTLVRCEYCAGQGEVFGKDGYGVPCAQCDGKGKYVPEAPAQPSAPVAPAEAPEAGERT